MPVTADNKPRNRDRREKFQASYRKENPTPTSVRSVRRRVLQRACQSAATAQIQLEKTLREVGVRWRDVEKQVQIDFRGDWSKISTPWLNHFLDENVHVTKEAA